MSRPRFRVPVPSRMARGLLVVVLAVSAATCRIGDLIGHSKLAVLEVDPDSVSDSAAVGSTAPRINPVDVINDGDGDLDWKAVIKHHSSWLTLDPDSGRAGVTPSLRTIFDPT